MSDKTDLGRAALDAYQNSRDLLEEARILLSQGKPDCGSPLHQAKMGFLVAPP